VLACFPFSVARTLFDDPPASGSSDRLCFDAEARVRETEGAEARRGVEALEAEAKKAVHWWVSKEEGSEEEGFEEEPGPEVEDGTILHGLMSRGRPLLLDEGLGQSLAYSETGSLDSESW
jgi:hypothetical protein